MYNSDMTKNSYYEELMGLSGISSVFVRGYMTEYHQRSFDKPGAVKLRDCQDAGVKAVEDLDGTISVPTVSKRSRLLVDAGVVSRRKVGKSYVQGDGPNVDQFLKFLDQDEDYGTRLVGSVEEDDQRNAAWNILEEQGAIRVNAENRLPTPAFKMLMGLVNSGKLDVVFVKPETVMGVKNNGKTYRIEAE